MKILLKGLQKGKHYVYIDGWVFPSEQRGLRFDGWYARHELERVPQAAALEDRTYLEQTLDSEEYWHARRLEEE